MKKMLPIILAFVFLYGFLYFLDQDREQLDKNVLKELSGTIYYTERVDGILTLFRSNADLTEKTLFYSHEGKGPINDGDWNDNIIDFYYDSEQKLLTFVAMNEGELSTFQLRDGEREATVIQQGNDTIQTDYLKESVGERNIFMDRCSVKMKDGEKVDTLQKFRGLCTDKFTGYGYVGLSPNGNHLIYRSLGHHTPFGTILEGVFNDDIIDTYIMNVETKKSAPFINSSTIQWVK